jgi:hypothetical protein
LGDGIRLDDGETWRINRANIALLLHIKPSEVDLMPEQDIADLMAINNGNQQISEWRSKQRRK